jgi:periplasmic divalent cation tolerance protein
MASRSEPTPAKAPPTVAGTEPGAVIVGSGSGTTDAVVVLSNAPDMLLAKRIAHVLVEEALVACASLGSPCLSMYMWDGTLQGAEEIPLVLKTTRQRVPALVGRLRQLHPDVVPEVLVLPVLGGAASYLDWVAAQVK